MFEEGIKHRRVEAGEFKHNTKEWKKEGDVTISSDIDIDELDCGKDRYAIYPFYLSVYSTLAIVVYMVQTLFVWYNKWTYIEWWTLKEDELSKSEVLCGNNYHTSIICIIKSYLTR